MILFRIVFGLLITLESFGAIATGWVRKNLVEPSFTFNFIGFDFLQIFQGEAAYFLFVLMGIFGIFVMIGFRYRFSMIAYALLWTAAYLMQKTSYNNHYYLLMLLSWLMVFLPASRRVSIDAEINPEIKSNAMPRWVWLVVVFQIWIVYTYASLAKLYPGWLDGSAIAAFMYGKKDYWLIGEFLQNKMLQTVMVHVGIYFDLLIVPLLLWRRTRVPAFILSIIFHLSNSIIFQIGIFPYLALAYSFFFFSPETLNRYFLRKEPLYKGNEIEIPKNKNLWIGVFSIYFIFQIGLPLRHHFFQGDVLWTEEGHRLSWRMMLRSKSGTLSVYVKEKGSEEKTLYNYFTVITQKQSASVATKPDLMWQLAQRIKEVEKEKGRDVEVYMESWISINRGPYHELIDSSVDLASEKWSHFRHSSWILPEPEDLFLSKE